MTARPPASPLFRPWRQTGRSLGGYDRPGVIALDGTTLNYFQWVFMDMAADGVLYAYDDAVATNSRNMDLTAAVVPGQTYHVLLLAGYNPDPGVVDPTLLASAYTRFTADGTGTVNLTLIPVVVDVKFSGGADGDRQIGRLAKTVGLDAGRTYTLEYFIGSSDRDVKATDDALKQALNDGLWPLKLATPDVRTDDTWRYKYSELNNGVRETLKTYQTGVLDTVEVPLNNARGANLAWVQWGNDPNEGMNDLNVNQNKLTTGRGAYTLTITKPHTTEGAVWLNLEYVPFSVFDDEAWRTVQRPATATALTERPVWVIRNGLNDNPQDASSWTSGMAYDWEHGNGNGGIAIGVVDPANALVGLFEDNNPWPIANTGMNGSGGDLTAALDYLNTNGAKAKYGDYTVRLGAQPDDQGPFTLGSGDYEDINTIALVIEGTVPIELPPASDFFPPQPGSGVMVSYGDGVTGVVTFTVTYNMNDGSGSVHATKAVKTPATTVVTLPVDPIRTDYIFNGWKDGNNGDFTGLTTVDADIDVYAQWTAKTSSINFNMTDGTGTQGDVTATYDQPMPAITVKAVTPDNTRTIFAGYYDDETVGTKYYNENGTSARIWDKEASPVTLYAHWRDLTVRDPGPSVGYIFYDKLSVSDGWRYMEAAPSDSSTYSDWGVLENNPIGGTSTAIGTGPANTARIIEKYPNPSPLYAAHVCKEAAFGGHTGEWFLPSSGELRLMYENLYLNESGTAVDNLGNFAPKNYWYSTENASKTAYSHNFNGTGRNLLSSSMKVQDAAWAFYVRAARKF
jgi:uncharacterized repeat protein (TIGR02543 family)